MALTRSLSTDPARARRDLYVLLQDATWPGDAEILILAVHEAMMNSERHAGGVISAVARADGTTVVVEVHDGGSGFDMEDLVRRPPDPLAERGRGLWLITQIADGWRIDRNSDGTCLRLLFQA